MSWFEVKVSYVRNQADRPHPELPPPPPRGGRKKVKGVYLVNAMSCADAEAKMVQELNGTTNLSVLGVRPSRADVLYPHIDGLIYRAKVVTVALDERTGVERDRTVVHVLPADDITEALQVAQSLDYADDVISVERTNIAAIIP